MILTLLELPVVEEVKQIKLKKCPYSKKCRHGNEGCSVLDPENCVRFLPLTDTNLIDIDMTIETPPEIDITKFEQIFSNWIESLGWGRCGCIKPYKDEESKEDMVLINQHTRRELSKDEVYVFSVVLCDNDIDRNYERFTVESLFELQKLFVGKTGIFDHNPSAKNQSARIFYCCVEQVKDKKTATGDDYYRLVAKAYIEKSKENEEIILAIESGITKEVSIGCAVRNTLCSICGEDINSSTCTHIKGKKYDGKMCCCELIGVYDAYEFSVVAGAVTRKDV